MEKNKKYLLHATMLTLMLLVLVFLDVIPSTYGMPVVLLLLGVVNIVSGNMYKKEGRKTQGSMSMFIGYLVLAAFVYNVVMLFV